MSGGDRDVAGGLWLAGLLGSRLWDGADTWAFVEEGGGDRSAAPRELWSWGGPPSCPQLGRDGQAFTHQQGWVTERGPPGRA